MLDASWLIRNVRANGGITCDPVRRLIVNSGYAVSLPGNEFVCDDRDLEYRVLSYLRDRYHIWLLADHYFGAWYVADQNVWYLDVTIVVPDRATAMNIGRMGNQIAIYHLDSGETIKVK